MTTVTIESAARGHTAPPIERICSQMTGTLHARVTEQKTSIPGWIVLTVTAPKDRVEIACELWLSAHYERWRVE